MASYEYYFDDNGHRVWAPPMGGRSAAGPIATQGHGRLPGDLLPIPPIPYQTMLHHQSSRRYQRSNPTGAPIAEHYNDSMPGGSIWDRVWNQHSYWSPTPVSVPQTLQVSGITQNR